MSDPLQDILEERAEREELQIKETTKCSFRTRESCCMHLLGTNCPNTSMVDGCCRDGNCEKVYICCWCGKKTVNTHGPWMPFGG